MSTLNVKNLQGISPSNRVTVPTGQVLYAPGHVLQVVQTVKTDSWTAAPGTGAYSQVTGFSASITPASTSSKIMVMINAHVGYASYMMKALVKRNGSIIVQGDASGTKPRVSFGINGYAGSTTYDQYHIHPTAFNYLDSPGTTGVCTYTLELGCYSSYTVTLNRNYTQQESSGDYDPLPASTFTLMEIAQ